MLTRFAFSVVGMLIFGSAHAGGPSARSLEGVINLNTATAEELQILSGVGPAKVRNILAYRRVHLFRTVEELARIKGIGHKMVRKLRQHLAVSGPTTAQQVIRPVLPPGAPAQNLRPLPPVPVPRPAPRPVPVQPPVPNDGVPPMLRRPSLPPPPPRPLRPIRQPLPGIVYPDGAANHCPRPA